MKTITDQDIRKNKVAAYALAVIAVLLVPFIAMQFTEEVDWGFADFVIIALLLFSAAFIYEFISSRIQSINKKLIVAGLVVVAVALIWAELGVGIFGSPFAGS